MRKPAHLLALGLFALTASPTYSQGGLCDFLSNADITLAQGPGGALVSLWVSGPWPVQAAPSLTSATQSARQIRAVLEGTTFGAQVVLPFWEDTISVGPLPTGTYDVFLDILLDVGTSSELTVFCGPRPVTISATAVPIDSALSRALLIASLALAAWIALRRLT